jgi:hypothetical protein
MSKLSDKCEQVYIEQGQYAVFDFILANYPKTPWAWCPPCESRSPIDKDYSCLVCASPTVPYDNQDGSNE